MFNLSVAELLRSAGHHELAQAFAILLGTFILEDAATVLAAIDAEAGGMPIWLALVSLYAGVILGDFGLYGLGRLCDLVPWLHRFVGEHRIQRGQDWLHGRRRRVFKLVVISRFLPGMRLPSYTACGFLHANFAEFAAAVVVAVLIWTSGLFAVSFRVGKVIMAHFGVWRWGGVGGFVVVVIALGWAAARWKQASDESKRRNVGQGERR